MAEATERVTVRYRPGELEQVRQAAAALGLPVSAYIRVLSLGEPPRRRPGVLTREAIHQLARVGSNLNQLARFANTHGHLSSASELAEVLAQVRRKIEGLSR
jgi:hypothetical protein